MTASIDIRPEIKLEAERSAPLLIKEVILENFMSYEFSRIPFKPGLNLICGPNGSGKSSILLGISVALGQAYTERSRKLSDLVRRGKDIARATVVFDNSPVGGRRPIPRYPTDRLMLSRYLKKDGTYWYEINYREVSKEEIVKDLREHGIDPDNLLIIMHQGMLEDFIIASSQQKLRMVEDAIGLKAYREKILEAQKRLSEIVSEEESISNLIVNAEQTLTHWKEEYEKFLRRNELLEKREALEKELAWSQVIKRENDIRAIEEKIRAKKAKLEYVARKIDETRALVEDLQGRLNGLTLEQRKLFYALMGLEKEKSEAEAAYTLLGTFISKLKGERLRPSMRSYVREAKAQLGSYKKKVRRLSKEIMKIQSRLGTAEKRLSSTFEKYVNERVRGAVLDYRRQSIEEEIAELSKDIARIQKELKELTVVAEKISPRIETLRSPIDISSDIKVTNAYLLSLGDVSKDAEKMYQHYSSLYKGLKDKLRIVSENREKTLEEVRLRMEHWKRMLSKLIEEVSPIYNEILSSMDAVGGVRLVNMDDVENAGLELLVGFRGASPSVLNPYTQSGGERSVSVISFLLALQRHIKSPFRAVDEFDIHMDPRNREAIYRFFTELVGKAEDFQNIVITPSPVASIEKDVHVITVQNVRGVSEVKVVTHDV